MPNMTLQQSVALSTQHRVPRNTHWEQPLLSSLLVIL